MTTLYTHGADAMGGGAWTTDTFEFLLLKGTGYTPNKDHHFVSELTPASNECSVASYSRVTMTSPVRTPDTTNDKVIYDCDNIDFGSLESGETVTGLVLYKFVTDDSDHILVAHFDLGTLPLTGSSFQVIVGTGGVMDLAQAA